jgi:hypothetical protein
VCGPFATSYLLCSGPELYAVVLFVHGDSLVYVVYFYRFWGVFLPSRFSPLKSLLPHLIVIEIDSVTILRWWGVRGTAFGVYW